jgi:hypothetical protein
MCIILGKRSTPRVWIGRKNVFFTKFLEKKGKKKEENT